MRALKHAHLSGLDLVTKCSTSYRILFLFLVSMFLPACSPSKVDIYGSYRAEYPAAKEVLILKSDGYFTQQVTLKQSGKVNKSEGTWVYESDGIVTFNQNFIVVTDAYGDIRSDYSQPAKGLVGLPAESWFGRISLGVDKGILYTKTGSL